MALEDARDVVDVPLLPYLGSRGFTRMHVKGYGLVTNARERLRIRPPVRALLVAC